MEKKYQIEIVQQNRKARKEFIDFPKRLYKGCKEWTPLFDADMRLLLSMKHPFFLHSEGVFLLLKRDGQTVARILIAENELYNRHHGTDFVFFDFFDCIDDSEAARELFNYVSRWAQSRGFTGLCGPILLGGAYGAGFLIDGFENLPAMTMMKYNFPYYRRLLEEQGFEKYVDLNSFSIPPEDIGLPDRMRRIAEIVLARGRFKALRFESKRDLRKIAPEIKELYGKTLNHHLEDYPLTPEELDQVEKDLFTIIEPDLLAVLTYDDKVVGFAIAFADTTEKIQKNGGKLGPVQIIRLLQGMKKSKKILFNGIGILPEYQRLGGNALLYHEMNKMVTSRNFTEVEMVQISEETKLMLKDAHTLGGKPYKVHRMFKKKIQTGETLNRSV